MGEQKKLYNDAIKETFLGCAFKDNMLRRDNYGNDKMSRMWEGYQ